MKRTIEGFRGFTHCLDGAKEKGIVYGLGTWKIGEIKKTTAPNEAYRRENKYKTILNGILFSILEYFRMGMVGFINRPFYFLKQIDLKSSQKFLKKKRAFIQRVLYIASF